MSQLLSYYREELPHEFIICMENNNGRNSFLIFNNIYMNMYVVYFKKNFEKSFSIIYVSRKIKIQKLLKNYFHPLDCFDTFIGNLKYMLRIYIYEIFTL